MCTCGAYCRFADVLDRLAPSETQFRPHNLDPRLGRAAFPTGVIDRVVRIDQDVLARVVRCHSALQPSPPVEYALPDGRRIHVGTALGGTLRM